MRLENVIALTNAALLNTPYVTSFSGISIEAKNLKRGSLFIARNNADIELAIANGAYGIVFDSPTQITDNEIAWIKVDDVAAALSRILRFHILDKNLTAYECDEITIKLALQIMTDSTLKILNGDIYETFKELWEMNEDSVVLFSSRLAYKEIFVNPKSMPKLAASKINIIEQTLFETSFIYEDKYYERQLLSPFFIPYLEILLHMFKTQKINFRITSFSTINHFEAVFTNKNFEAKEFGTSDKVLIFEPSFELIGSQIDFLQTQANWAKIIYIIPSGKKKNMQNTQNIYTYNTQLDIIDILRDVNFHFALIAEQNKSLLEKSFFVKKQRQLTLDF
ncbi:hypothetical protein [Sulfurimonas sp. HSL-1716]|uniref:hypothetical protein n=1 Tax=Hydrocurvibacter sulfurireducens TaxID=3131937 RepID=UPI0031FA0020